MKKSLLFTACVIVGLGAIKFFGAAESPSLAPETLAIDVERRLHPGEKTLPASEITTIVQTTSEPALAFASFIKTLPASLADQPAPELLTIDEKGNLVVDGKIRFLFEHYLSALGEESLENIVARITYALQAQLTGDNLERGNRLLEAYLQYRNYLGEVKNDYVNNTAGQGYDLGLVVQMKQQVNAERLRFFSEADSQALFLQEDQYDEYQLARAQVAADAGLSPEQQQAKLMQIDTEAPSWITDSERQSTLVSRVRADEKLLIAQGADAETLYATRASAYGTEAAQRLALVDQDNQRWQARVYSYQIELQSLVASSAGGSVNTDLLQSLRGAHFQGTELVRIAALDDDRGL